MTPEDFYTARKLEEEGWEYLGLNEGGDMMFARVIGGIVFSADVSVSR